LKVGAHVRRRKIFCRVPPLFFGSTRTFWWALFLTPSTFWSAFCLSNACRQLMCVCAPAAYIARNLRRVRYADRLEGERNEGDAPPFQWTRDSCRALHGPQWGPDRQKILCSLDGAVRKPLLGYRPNIYTIYNRAREVLRVNH